MGRSGKQLDRLIDEVSRGKRDLASITDADLREAVRIALRMHKETPERLDAYAKARMRARIMSGLERRARDNAWTAIRDNAWTAIALLAKPAPYIVRGVAVACVLAIGGMGAIVASADSLPDDLLYPVKIATEQVRLALADAPGDRAAVELSIAEHRLREAEKLAASGRTSDAFIASAIYTQHVASAAAELAPADSPDLGAQLESSFAAQLDRAQSLAATLSQEPKSARGAQVLGLLVSPTFAPGKSEVERVADTAASLAADIASAAEQVAVENAGLSTPAPSGTARRSES
ncbi:MAG TPA: DUF5667 domain-containing protein, partial [Candidatus Limnocylindria bacterium]|nr:DUF5667 domain-containing protein [Candidatus Limnocylindria bacterium]